MEFEVSVDVSRATNFNIFGGFFLAVFATPYDLAVLIGDDLASFKGRMILYLRCTPLRLGLGDWQRRSIQVPGVWISFVGSLPTNGGWSCR